MSNKELEKTIAELRAENLGLRERLRPEASGRQSGEDRGFLRDEEKYRLLFDSAPNPILFLDLDGAIIECNLALPRALGVSKEALIGRIGFELPVFEPADRERLRSIFADLRAGGRAPEPFTIAIHNQGEEAQWLEFHLSPVTGGGGVVGILLHTRNVTSYVKVAREMRIGRELMQMVADNLPVLIAYRDRDHRYMYANREYGRWFGISSETIPGQPLAEVVGAANLSVLQPHLERVARGETVGFEDELTMADGKKLVFYARYLPHFSAQGEFDGYFVLVDDIADRKLAEAQMKRGLRVNSILADLAKSIIDPQLSIDAIAEKALEGAKKMTGSESGFIGLLDPANKDLVEVSLSRTMRASSPANPTARLRFSRDERGDYPGFLGLALNTRRPTYSNKAEHHPRADSLPRGHVPIRKFLSVPALAGEELVGEIALANPARDYTEADLENVGRLADLFALAVIRLRTEAALKESESRYRTLYEQSPISIWEVDLSRIKTELDRWRAEGIADPGVFIDENPGEFRSLISRLRVRNVNQATLDLYRASVREDVAVDFNRFLIPESYPVMKRQLMALTGGKFLFEAEMPMLTLNGDRVLIFYKIIIPEEYRENWEVAIVSVNDITESRRYQEALHKSAVEWRTTFDAMTDPLFILNPEHRITRVNLAAARLFGLSPEKTLGRFCWELIHPDEPPADGCIHALTMRDGREHLSERTVNGRVYLCSTSPIYDNQGVLIGSVHLMHDITETKRIEEERMRSSKLESIGVLAGGIAHDFNNILMGIMGNISLARMELEEGDDPSESLEAAEKASALARNLTRQLLTFSRGGAPVKTIAPLRQVIEEATTFVAHGSNVRCRLDFAPDLGALEIDVGQISQVAHNLVLNAIQAMPAGGEVTVAAENLRMEEGADPAVPAGDWVRISVIDRGVGIPAEDLPKIFDPYFTTKEKGTGLGLATCYSIVKRHGGVITVGSEPEKGSSFFVYLPAPRQLQISPPAHEEKIITGKGRVLLMDDEEIVRHVASRMLAKLGYQTVEARDGAEAVEKFLRAREEGRPFQAVIMDLTVPGGMGGKDAAQALLAIDPDVRAIVASGYSEDPVMSDCRAFGFRGMVAKPFKVADLGRALEEAIGERANPA